MFSSLAIIPYFGKYISTTVTLSLLFVLFYFAYTSYAILPDYKLKKLFPALIRIAYTKINVLLPAYLFSAVLVVLEYYFFIRSMSLGGAAAGIFAVLIIFPTVAWSRFYAITVLEK